MSKSGQENFQKENIGDQNLDFDSSAFYYFSFALLFTALVPSTYYYIIRPLCFGEVAIDRSDFQNCECKICKKRLKERKAVHRWDFFNQGFIVKLFIIVFGWVLLLKCWILVKDLEPLEGFNPHKLLGIEKEASIKEVKRAYRKLSKTMHPDKNPDSPQAIDDFLKITKAHQILTDPIARDNFAKYGNPDGQHHVNVGIALPETLSRKDQQIFVLFMFFLGFNAINCYFYFDLTKEEQDLGGVSMKNRPHFEYLIDHDTMGKRKIPAILGQGVELASMKCRNKEEFQIIKRLQALPQLKGAIPVKKQKEDQDVQVKPVCLLLAYLFNLFDEKELQNKGIQEDIDTLMRLTPSYIDIMVQETLKLIAMLKQNTSYKRVSGHNVLGILQFSQNMIQNGFDKPDPYAQLPGLTAADILLLKVANGDIKFLEFLTLEEEKRNEMLKKAFDGKKSDEDIEEIKKCIVGLPVAKLSSTAEVQGSIDVAVNDMLTITIRVEFPNLQKNKTTGYICSNNYKYLRKDGWYLIVTDKSFTGVAVVEKIDIEQEFYEKKIQEKLGREGEINFVVLLVNDSYKGLDLMDEVFLTAAAEKSHTYVEYEYTEFDKKAIKQSSNIFTCVDPDTIELVDSDSDQDEEKKPLEPEEDELIRRLKNGNCCKASCHMVEAIKNQKIKDEKEKEIQKAEVTLKSNFDQAKITAQVYKKDEKKSPFVLKWQKSKVEMDALKNMKKQKVEHEEKVAKADKELMSTARDPVPIEAYKVLTGYNGIDEQLVAFVPATPWHMSNTYFDGIKYTGPLNQNPINPLTVEEFMDMHEASMEMRKNLQEQERARYQKEMQERATIVQVPKAEGAWQDEIAKASKPEETPAAEEAKAETPAAEAKEEAAAEEEEAEPIIRDETPAK